MTAHPAYQLDWNLVRTFTAVVNSGSLAGAARVLGLAHPTVARHVQQLEASLGVALFDRTRRGLALNDAGRRLSDAAHRMRSGALAFESASDHLRNAPAALVRVTVAELLAEALPGLLTPALQADADGSAVVELIVSDQALNLLERDADIALRHVRPRQRELVCRRLGVLPLGIFGSATYLAGRPAPCADSLASHAIVDSVSPHRFVQGANARGIALTPECISFRSNSLACQARAVAAGWGLGCLPLHAAALHPGLVRVMDDLVAAEIEVWLVARPEVRMNDTLKAAFDRVAERVTTILG